ncbi:MAG TPA: WbqC family protein [Oscillatoriaceae cyanobacterium]
MKVAIIQSNYLPWKGYFDVIHDVDCFVFYDDVQYTARDWRNRNQIKTPHGTMWLSVPVAAGSRDRRIDEVTISGTDWAEAHWASLRHSYARAPHFKHYEAFLEHVYRERNWEYLSDLNRYLIERIARDFLGISTRFVLASDLEAQGQKQDRLLDVLQKLGATAYLSGPAARAYIDSAGFEASGIALEYKDYGGYPEYPQVFPPFRHDVSILDLLFQVGPDSAEYIWGWRQGFEKTARVPQAKPALEGRVP